MVEYRRPTKSASYVPKAKEVQMDSCTLCCTAKRAGWTAVPLAGWKTADGRMCYRKAGESGEYGKTLGRVAMSLCFCLGNEAVAESCALYLVKEEWLCRMEGT